MHSTNTRHAAAAALLVLLLSQAANAADWITAPSYYTHDWSRGERVAQYQPVGPFYYFQRPDYLKSGYQNYRSTIDLGNSSDNLHIVDQWGAPVVPYEQWRFPYRPYSVPYDAWGPPYGGLGGGTGGYPYSGGFGANFFGGAFPPFGFGYGGFGGPAAAGPGAAGPSAMGPGFGGPGGFPGGFPGGHPGRFPSQFGPPAANFAQPWLDGHYPSYDFNDRSQYWRPYVAPNRAPGF